MSRPATTPTLTEFLLARIAEDEAVVKAVTPYNPQHGYSDVWASHDGEYTQSDAAFVDHNDPARVLAECEAKRRIVADHAPSDQAHGRSAGPGVVMDAYGDPEPIYYEPACKQCTTSCQDWRVTSDWDQANRVVYPCDTLRYLAAVYADHPDYNEAWRP